ncbi:MULTISPECIES: formate dehydrogenase subunit gamma [unclassified Bradyrhizobium]|uniref:formate dehydrogenase subunit gamma n=1 Tax=unclassified Bradyrhizobium TaxID=2631580 RepID=UPI001BA9B25F|nr:MULTISPECIES: formate dehydrogenase subunit gamma [unclassified Bradyrhizobium]MBR1225768.1 formate dehydrogenase subunit gamma [Bradyrhizobium sp. AUGA SZCCT0176]MBR1236247.1 formate dehydrogenase subunit gamma [Bradyrhizobium sp. AUGA SZCCT0182]MBR1301206.1 formate dehydrogenase subunit gamma [Bradyrhizobium sp. AUGA SZCCT0042]
MPSSLSHLRALCAAIALLFVFAHPAAAQLTFKPTAEAVQEDKLLNALKEGDKITGRISIPDTMASSLIQPAGRDWRDFQRSKLPIIGGVAILGMIALLAIFLMVRGRIRVDHGFSGTKILRFASFERFTHWLTASCFVVLALSGLNISFGRVLIMPLFGAQAFATMSGWAKIAHDYLAFPFMLGLAIMFLIWIKDNIPGKLDWQWIKQGGGILPNGKHPPAKRFNAGQKGIFWIVIIGGVLMSVSGWFMLFPYLPANVTALQFWTVIHAVIAMLFIAVMLAHIYIGSVGMEGAFDAMGTGEVDLNWAKEHHALWVAEEQAKGRAPSKDGTHAVAAE